MTETAHPLTAAGVLGLGQTPNDPFLDRASTLDLRHALLQTEGMISLPEAQLLYACARECVDGCVVEVGSYRGRSTVALGLGSLDGGGAPVYAIEPHEDFVGVLGGVFGSQDRGAFFYAMLATGAYHAVRLVNLSSEDVASSWRRPVGVLWIDGDHSEAGVRRDFGAWEPHLCEGATVLFDDATDPALGPAALIAELCASRGWSLVHSVGKVVALQRATDPS